MDTHHSFLHSVQSYRNPIQLVNIHSFVGMYSFFLKNMSHTVPLIQSMFWSLFVIIFIHEEILIYCFPCFLQVLAWRVQGSSEHQWLSRHLLSLLWGSSIPRAHGALHPLHGQPRGLHFLPAQDAWLQALGVQPSQRSWRTPPLLREVPALHSLLPGLWVQAWTRVLLHL